jgi:hypothetical protein
MVNLKYPSALKGKSSMAWLGALGAGFAPLFYFYLGGLSSEHYTGRQCTNMTPSFFIKYLRAHHFNQSVLSRELLDKNPNYKYSELDKRRLGLK